jgi:chromosome segregation ATPase
MIATALQALADRVTARTSTAEEIIARNAMLIAKGQGYDIGAVEAALFETRTTLDQFQRMVETGRQRIEHMAHFSKLPAAQAAHDRLGKQIEASAQKFQTTIATLAEARQKLDAELAGVTAQLTEGNRAREWLAHPDHVLGPLSGQLRDAQQAVAAGNKQTEELGRYLNEATARVKREQGWLDHITKTKDFDPNTLTHAKKRQALDLDLDDGTLDELDRHHAALRRATQDATAAKTAHDDALAALAQARETLASLTAKALAEA